MGTNFGFGGFRVLGAFRVEGSYIHVFTKGQEGLDGSSSGSMLFPWVVCAPFGV
jgi:hypothetical protein